MPKTAKATKTHAAKQPVKVKAPSPSPKPLLKLSEGQVYLEDVPPNAKCQLNGFILKRRGDSETFEILEVSKTSKTYNVGDNYVMLKCCAKAMVTLI